MSATSPTTPPVPEPTQADHDAMFASVVWFREQRASGTFEEYEGMNVAILGEQIIDADRDEDELIRRLDALGGTLPQNRVVIQYVYIPEDLRWK
jgi:hypothetical protein